MILRRVFAPALILLLVLVAPLSRVDAAPEGQLTWGVHITLAPTWFDPAETPGIITPFMVFYALHDAMVKPMPGKAADAEPGRVVVGREGRARLRVRPAQERPLPRRRARHRRGREVLLRALPGHRGKGFKDRVAAVETPDPGRVRFRLKQPWPDFMTFYSSATGADWIVPKKYVERVGDEGFKKAPIGAGPYKFVSFTPGVELVLEAFEQYWRKSPSVKRLVLRVIPDESTRLAALKRGEVDLAYSMRGELAEELQRTPGLALKPAVIQGTFWLYFPDQWDPKSPWHDRRVRSGGEPRDRSPGHQPGADAGLSGHQQHHPQHVRLLLGSRPPRVRPARAKKLLAEAGLPQWLRRGRLLLRRRPTATSARPSQLPRRRWASARSSGRWSARPSSRATRTRSSRTSSRARAAPSATPPPALEAFVVGRRAMSTAAIRTSTGSSRSRRRSWTASARGHAAQDPAARPRARALRAHLAAGVPERRGPRVANPASASSPATPTPRPTRT